MDEQQIWNYTAHDDKQINWELTAVTTQRHQVIRWSEAWPPCILLVKTGLEYINKYVKDGDLMVYINMIEELKVWKKKNY